MKRLLTGGTSAFALSLLALPAAAQITPEEVWQNWQDSYAAGGWVISGADAQRDGDSLVVSGATFSVDDGTGQMVDIPVSPITLTDKGDGTVLVTLPETVTFTTPAAPDGEVFTVSAALPGTRTTASGTPEAVSYDTVIPTMTVDLDVTGGILSADLVLAVTNATAASTYAPAAEEAISLDGTASIENLTLGGTMANAETQEAFRFDLSFADMNSTLDGNMFPLGASPDMAAAMANGFSLATGGTFGAMSLAIDGTSPTGPSNVAYTAVTGDYDLGIGLEGLRYAFGLDGMSLALSGADIPVPEIRVGIANLGFDLSMPLAATGSPDDFVLVTRLQELTLSDEIWGMLDPMAQLPRDPLTLVIDTAGQILLTTSLFDDAAMAQLGAAPPGEVQSLNVNALQLKGLGADVTGDGQLTFDNTDLATFGGVPAPTGTINLAATGVNGLIDKLVAMGMVPEDQAMGARMMLSMFANVAADGTDSMTSVIEFRDKGLFVNGQQLQ